MITAEEVKALDPRILHCAVENNVIWIGYLVRKIPIFMPEVRNAEFSGPNALEDVKAFMDNNANLDKSEYQVILEL